MKYKSLRWGYWLGWSAWLVSALWAALCLSYGIRRIGFQGLLELAPQEIGEFIAGVLSLPIFLWMVVGHWQRLDALKANTIRLQEQLDALLNPDTNKIASNLMASVQKQTDALKAASQNAIDTLRGVRGLVHLEAEALEQISSKAAAQFETISAALKERAAALDVASGKAEGGGKQAIESLQSLETSTDRVTELGETMKQRITALDSLGIAIADRLEKGGGLIDERIKQLSDISGRFTEQQKDLNESGSGFAADFRAVSDRVAESSGLIGEWLRQWAATGEQISIETKNFEEIARQRAEALETTAASLGRITGDAVGAVDRLREGGETFAQTRLEFDAGLKSISQRLDEAAGKLDGQISIIDAAEKRLGENLSTLADRSGQARAEHESLAETIRILGERTGGTLERLEGLRASSANGVEDFVFQSERMHRQMGMLEGDLQKNAEFILNALERMQGINQAIEHGARLVDAESQRAYEALSKTREGLEQTSRDIGVQGGIVAARSSDTIATLSEASSRITGMAVGALAQLQGAAHNLLQVNEEVASSSEKAELRITGAANALKAGAAEIEATVNHIDNASLGARQVTDALVAHGGVLRGTIGEAAESAAAAAMQLGGTIDTLHNTAQQTRRELTAASEQLRVENDLIFRTVNRVAELDTALRNSGAFVSEIAERARQTIEEVRDGVDKVGQEINVQTITAAEKFSTTSEVLNRTREELDRVVSKVDSTFGALNRKAGAINFVVSTSVNRLGEMSKGIENAKATIEDSTSGITAKLSDAASTLREEFAVVHQAAEGAGERLGRTASLIGAAAAKAEEAHARAEAQLGQSLGLIEKRGETFSHAVETAAESLTLAERAFVETQKDVSLLIEETGGRFDRLSRDVAAQTNMLGDSAGAAAEKLITASAEIEERIAHMGETVGASVSEAKTLMQDFSAETAVVSERTLEAARALAAHEESLRDGVVRLGTVADDVAGDLDRTTSALSVTTANMASAAGAAKGEILAATDELREQGRVITAAESESRALMEKVAELIGEKSVALALAVRETATHTASLREADAKARRDLFLGAAKAVLDGLGSLSVDLTRVLDQDIPEKVWKSFNRGDMSAFPRRLAGLRDQIPVSEIRTKFISDGAFRLSVQTYLTQFEQLLEQAMEIGQGDILSSTLMSSDVGKIYYFLSAAVGRERGLQKAG